MVFQLLDYLSVVVNNDHMVAALMGISNGHDISSSPKEHGHPLPFPCTTGQQCAFDNTSFYRVNSAGDIWIETSKLSFEFGKVRLQDCHSGKTAPAHSSGSILLINDIPRVYKSINGIKDGAFTERFREEFLLTDNADIFANDPVDKGLQGCELHSYLIG